MDIVNPTRELRDASIPAYHPKGQMIGGTTMNLRNKSVANDGSASAEARKRVHYLRPNQASLASEATN